MTLRPRLRVRQRLGAALVAALAVAPLFVVAPAVDAAIIADTYHGVTPARVLDTRAGYPTADGLHSGGGALGPDVTLELPIAGRGGVPAVGAGAVALNVAVANPTSGSFLTVFPTGQTRPTAASANFAAGQTVSNMVIAKLGTDGKVSIYNFGGTVDVIVDVLGWFPLGESYTGLTPARALDTRPGYSTIDGQFAGGGPVGANGTLELTVAGRGGVPDSGAGSVALNVAVTNPSADSFLTVFPTGDPRPTAASANFVTGQTVSNMVIAKIGAGGKVSIYNLAGSVDVVVDILGWFPSGDAYTGLTPGRVLDTRPGFPTVDAQFQGAGPIAADGTFELTVAGRGGVPASGAGSVALNVAVANATSSSFVTVFPTGSTRPTAASVNFLAGQTVSNMVIAKLGTDGKVSIYNFGGSVDVIVDVLGWFPATDSPASTIRANLRPNGNAAGGGPSQAPSISDDGRYVAFDSGAHTLVADDVQGAFFDVFVRDTVANTTVRASVSSAGVAGDADSRNPALSGNARYVAFESGATNLVDGDTNALIDVFVRDLQANTTTRVSLTAANTETLTGNSTEPAISSDGRYVAFTSDATDLVPNDTNGMPDVFVRDLVAGTTTRVSVATGGGEATNAASDPGGSLAPDISADGRWVVFQSDATNLVPGDTNARFDVFLHDRETVTTSRVSVRSDGGEAQNGQSRQPAISDDGRFVAFESGAVNLVDGDNNAVVDVFLRDLEAGTTVLISVSTTGAQGSLNSTGPTLTPDGRFVAFNSRSPELTSHADNDAQDVFLRDTVTGTTSLVSAAPGDVPGAGGSTAPSIAHDGRHIAFQSSATNLVENDTNGLLDIFVRDVGTI